MHLLRGQNLDRSSPVGPLPCVENCRNCSAAAFNAPSPQFAIAAHVQLLSSPRKACEVLGPRRLRIALVNVDQAGSRFLPVSLSKNCGTTFRSP